MMYFSSSILLFLLLGGIQTTLKDLHSIVKKSNLNELTPIAIFAKGPLLRSSSTMAIVEAGEVETITAPQRVAKLKVCKESTMQ